MEPVCRNVLEAHIFIDDVLGTAELADAAVEMVFVPMADKEPQRLPADLAVSLDRPRWILVVIKDQHLGIGLDGKAAVIQKGNLYTHIVTPLSVV